ncbi:phosphotransferase [Dyella acidisoli]|uniref:Phosphotransferase n=1 Tax=Dyella acidisoli TaxID=1867834 RepID=A0ABQ5XS66_9GAMM|nr:phosphotransferase [Dyella acidisoli]GLQ93345.1 phosphotransferase [Dyella acidisoli]
MLTRQSWAALIPHAEAMALIDAVVDWNETAIHAIGARDVPDSHPLRSPVGLHAVHLAEYGAQSLAVHAALLGEADARGGRLVSLRDVQLAVEYVDLRKGHLDVYAERIHVDDRGAQYRFKVEQQGQALASGRVAVMYVVE